MVTESGKKMLEMADASMVLTVAKGKQAETEKYDEQYDPNVDFAVFVTGDKTKGGLQSLKEKMNLADAGTLGEADSSDSDEGDEARRSSIQKSASPPLETPEMKIVDDTASSEQRKAKSDHKLPED